MSHIHIDESMCTRLIILVQNKYYNRGDNLEICWAYIDDYENYITK